MIEDPEIQRELMQFALVLLLNDMNFSGFANLNYHRQVALAKSAGLNAHGLLIALKQQTDLMVSRNRELQLIDERQRRESN